MPPLDPAVPLPVFSDPEQAVAEPGTTTPTTTAAVQPLAGAALPARRPKAASIHGWR